MAVSEQKSIRPLCNNKYFINKKEPDFEIVAWLQQNWDGGGESGLCTGFIKSLWARWEKVKMVPFDGFHTTLRTTSLYEKVYFPRSHRT